VNPDVVIVGGGIQGCSTALHLALQGVQAMVIEKNYCGRHASGVNAGGVLRPGRYPAELPLSRAALEIWADAESLVDDNCGFRPIGRLKIAESDEEMEKLAARHALVHRLGYTHERLIDRAELCDLEPHIAAHAVGGIYASGCGHANPFRTVSAFKNKARALGVEFLEGVRVDKISRNGPNWRVATEDSLIEAPVVVNCAGAWGDRIARDLGETVPLSTIAPMLMITGRLPPIMHQRIGAVDRVLSIVQQPNGTVIIGGGYLGTADRNAETTSLDYPRLAFNARIACDMFPVLKDARIVRCWAGIEGAMADGLPVIGPSATEENAYHAFGFSAHGFHLGPVVGRILAQLITSGHSDIPIDAFRIDRF
jgi:sarcosine oxidase subunit beta